MFPGVWPAIGLSNPKFLPASGKSATILSEADPLLPEWKINRNRQDNRSSLNCDEASLVSIYLLFCYFIICRTANRADSVDSSSFPVYLP